MTASAKTLHPPLGAGAAYGLLALCLPVWGINWPLLTIALGSIPPVWLSCVRMGSTALCLFAALAVLGRLRLPGRHDMPAVLSIGVLMMGIYPAMTIMGLEFAEAGRASLLSFITPLWVTPAAIILFGERLTRLKAAGLALGLGGVAVMFNPIGFDWSRSDAVYGNLLLVAASAVWSIPILHMRRHVWRLSPFQLAPWQLLAATLVAAPLALVVEAGETVRWSMTLFWLLLYAGPVATALTILGAVAIARALPAITASLMFLATPVAGMLASAAILGEALTVTNLAGLALIVTGLAAVAIGDARRLAV